MKKTAVALMVLALMVVTVGCQVTDAQTVAIKDVLEVLEKHREDIPDEVFQALEALIGNPVAEEPVVAEPVEKPHGRRNPAGIDNKITLDGFAHHDAGEFKLEITMVDLLRGEDAFDYMQEKEPDSWMMKNEPAREGHEWVMAKYKVSLIETEKDLPIYFHMGDIVVDGADYQNSISMIWGFDGEKMQMDIFEGGTAERWAFYQIPVGAETVVANWNKIAWFDLLIEY